MTKKKYDPSREREMISGDEDIGAIPETELAISPEMAMKETEKQEARKASQIITASEIEVPALKNLQPGDTMDLNVSIRVQRKDPKTGEFDLEVIDIYSTEEQAQPSAPAPAGGGGLESLLAGAQKA